MAGEAPIVNLSKRQQHAALLVAEDELTDREIVKEIGIALPTLYEWKRKPEFAELVAAMKAKFRERILSEGFADKAARVKSLNRQARKVERELDGEGDDLKPSGMYRKELKISANGEVVDYEVFDKPKFDTFRGLLDDIASEMGERKTGVEVSGDADNPLVLGLVGVDIGRV